MDFVCKDKYIFRVEIEHIVDIKIGTASGNYMAAPGRTESIVDKEKKEEISCIDVFVEEKNNGWNHTSAARDRAGMIGEIHRIISILKELQMK